MRVTCTSFQPFYIIETYQLREIQPFILFILMRNHSQTEEPSGASVTRHPRKSHVITSFTTSAYSFSFLFKKIDLIILSNTFLSALRKWPAPYVPKHTMSLLANQLFAPFIHALKPHADLAIKHSFAVITSPFLSASSAILTSRILRFSISDLPSSFFKAISLNINKISFSHKNKPCFPPHKLPSLMTTLSKTLMIKFAGCPRKSNNLLHSNKICCKPNVNCNAMEQCQNHTRPINSFIAAPIPNAMASCLPRGSALHAKNTLARTAENLRPLATIQTTCAIPTLSHPSPFLKMTRNRARIARYWFTKLKAATRCSVLSANAFGLGTPASLKLAVTIHTICSGCAKIPTGCHGILTTFCVDAKLIHSSSIACTVKSKSHSAAFYLNAPHNSLPFSHPFHPFLICAITICLCSLLTALTSIFMLARHSYPINSTYTNSSNTHDAII